MPTYYILNSIFFQKRIKILKWKIIKQSSYKLWRLSNNFQNILTRWHLSDYRHFTTIEGNMCHSSSAPSTHYTIICISPPNQIRSQTLFSCTISNHLPSYWLPTPLHIQHHLQPLLHLPPLYTKHHYHGHIASRWTPHTNYPYIRLGDAPTHIHTWYRRPRPSNSCSGCWTHTYKWHSTRKKTSHLPPNTTLL